MSRVTKKEYDLLKSLNKKVLAGREKLFERAKEVWAWENENIGTKHQTFNSSNWELVDIIFEPEDMCNFGKIGFTITYFYDEGAERYRGNDYYIDEYKLYSDNWKRRALDEYYEKKEEERKRKEEEKEKKQKLQIERDLAELKRLEEKYYGKSRVTENN